MNLISHGNCICIKEPMGAKGLEGYIRGEEYKFHLLHNTKGPYYRVFPDGNIYYETCDVATFKKYFIEKE